MFSLLYRHHVQWVFPTLVLRMSILQDHSFGRQKSLKIHFTTEEDQMFSGSFFQLELAQI